MDINQFFTASKKTECSHSAFSGQIAALFARSAFRSAEVHSGPRLSARAQ